MKKRDAALLLAVLLLGLSGRAAWRMIGSRPDARRPPSGVQNAFDSLFSRPPAPAYAPVDVPALAAPEPAKFGGAESPPAERWSAGAGAENPLGEAGGGEGPRAAASAGTGGAPRWQTPSYGAGGSASAGGGTGAMTDSPAVPAMKTLGRLERRAARSERVDVNLGEGGGGVPAPTPSAIGYAPVGALAAGDGGSAPAATGAGAAAAGPGSAPAAAAADGGPAPAALGSASGGADGGAAAGAAPAAADVAAPAASSTTADDGSAADPGAQQVAELTPVVGSPRITNGANGVIVQPSGFFFAARKGMGQTVQTMNIQAGSAQGVEFTSDLYVDPNGAGGWYIKDKTGRPTTALKYSKTESLNPGKIPYIVIPRNFRADYPNVKLGDYAAVTYGGKTLYAIVGDLGPPGVLGGGSIALASGLGMDPTPRPSGGAAGGVTYVILAGTRDRRPPRDAATIQSEGKQLFEKDGIPID
jgi:hypothetical protein